MILAYGMWYIYVWAIHTYIRIRIPSDQARDEIGDEIEHKNVCSSCAHTVSVLGLFNKIFLFGWICASCDSHDWLIDCLN